MTCTAYRSNDQMLCRCGLAWDVNDPEPPVCSRRATSRIARLFPALALVLLTTPAMATPRSPRMVRDFRALHACPATAMPRGACPGYQVDHVVPLCAGGVDAPANMQWLTVEAHRVKTRRDVQMCAVARRGVS